MALNLPQDIFTNLVPFLDALTTARLACSLKSLQSLTWRLARFWEFPTQPTFGRSTPWDISTDTPNLLTQLVNANQLTVKIVALKFLGQRAFTQKTDEKIISLIQQLSEKGALTGLILTTHQADFFASVSKAIQRPEQVRKLHINTMGEWSIDTSILRQFSSIESLGVSIVDNEIFGLIEQGVFPNLGRLKLRFSTHLDPQIFCVSAKKAIGKLWNRESFFLRMAEADTILKHILRYTKDIKPLDELATELFGLPKWSQLRIDSIGILWQQSAVDAAIAGRHVQFHQLMNEFFHWDQDDEQKNYIWSVAFTNRLQVESDWKDTNLSSFIDWFVSRLGTDVAQLQNPPLLQPLAYLLKQSHDGGQPAISSSSQSKLRQLVKVLLKRDVERHGDEFKHMGADLKYFLVDAYWTDRDWVSTLHLEESEFNLGVALVKASPIAPQLAQIAAWNDADVIDPVIREGGSETNLAEYILQHCMWLMCLIPSIVRALLRRSNQSDAVASVFSTLVKATKSTSFVRHSVSKHNKNFWDEMLAVPEFELSLQERQSLLDKILSQLISSEGFHAAKLHLDLEILISQNWCQSCRWPRSDADLADLVKMTKVVSEEALHILKAWLAEKGGFKSGPSQTQNGSRCITM